MFCQNCGAKNDDDAIFCESCGTRLERDDEVIANVDVDASESSQNQEDKKTDTEQPFVYQPLNATTSNTEKQGFGSQAGFGGGQSAASSFDVKNMDKMTLLCMIEAVILVVAVIVFFQVGKKMTSPEHIAEQYFVASMACDADGVYDTLSMDDSGEFLTKKALEQVMSDETPEKYKNYAVNKATTSGVISTVTIDYVDQDGEVNSTSVTLTKEGKKKLLFFDNWKVSGSDRVVSYFCVYVPEGADVAVDGVKMTEKYAMDGYEDGDAYEIHNIFAGRHNVTMSIGDLSGFEETVYVDPYYENVFSFSDLQLDEQTQQSLVELAYQDMIQIVNAGYANSPFSSIKDLYIDDKDVRDSADYYYDNLCNRFARGEDAYDYGITAVTFKDVTGSVEDVYYSDGMVAADVLLEYSYDASYVSSGWFRDKTGVEESDGTLSVVLEYQNGKWLLSSNGVPSLSY